MSKNYTEIGFNKGADIVNQILQQETELCDEKMAELLNQLENFILNYGSLCFAKGYELAKTEDKKIIEEI